jgi:hypothetical protein
LENCFILKKIHQSSGSELLLSLFELLHDKNKYAQKRKLTRVLFCGCGMNLIHALYGYVPRRRALSFSVFASLFCEAAE